MLITLTGIVLIVIGIIIIWLCIKVPKFKKVGKYLGIVFLSVGFAWMAFVFEVIGLQRMKEDSEIANNNKEYALLSASVCLLEENPAYEEKEIIIECVNEWNEKVENAQNGLKNPWTNWLYNKRVIEAMEHIEIPESVTK